MFRKELCYWRDQHNGRFPGLDDYDMWIRLWKEHRRFYNIPSIGILHRIHKQSASNATGNHNYFPDLIKHHMETKS